MTRPVKVALIVGAAVAVGVMARFAWKKQECNNILDQVADEGYETAHDILFPNNTRKRKKLRLGPIHLR